MLNFSFKAPLQIHSVDLINLQIFSWENSFYCNQPHVIYNQLKDEN